MSFSSYSAKETLGSIESIAVKPVKRGPTLHRPRACKACQYCRSRKVRCDWAATGDPCTNCRLDSRECTTVPRKQQVSRPRKHGAERKRKSKYHESGALSTAFPTPSPSESSRPEQLSPSSEVNAGTTAEWIETDQVDQFSDNCSKFRAACILSEVLMCLRLA